jgi:putative ABC transport system permease protein
VIPIAYNLRNLRVRKATTAAAALGLALVVFVFASVRMLANGIERAVHQAADPSVAIVLRKGSSEEMESGIEQTKVPLIAATPGVAAFPNGRPQGVGEMVAVVLLDKLGTEGGVANVQIRGIADDTLAFRPSVKIVEGRAAAPGTDEVIIGKAISGGLYKGIGLGQTFEMRKNRPMTIVGVFEDNGSAFESEIWADVDRVRANFGRGAIVSSVRVRLDSPSKFDGFKATLEANRQLDVTAMREEEFYEKQSQGTALFLSALGYLIAFFVSLGAIIGAMITMHATVAQRQREIGTLRALGFSRLQILTSFLIEAVALSLLGGVVGAAASLLMSLKHVSVINFATFSEIVFKFEPSVGIIVSAMVAAGVMGVLGGFWPAVRAARINPVVAMRGG